MEKCPIYVFNSLREGCYSLRWLKIAYLIFEELGEKLTKQDNGMEWNGMEWNGMEWNGMEWNGMEWNGMEWNGMNGVEEEQLTERVYSIRVNDGRRKIRP